MVLTREIGSYLYYGRSHKKTQEYFHRPVYQDLFQAQLSRAADSEETLKLVMLEQHAALWLLTKGRILKSNL